MAQNIHRASNLLFTKLDREWSLSALGTGDRWSVSSPDGSRLADIDEPMLKNPLRRAWHAMSPTYPVADRFHWLEFRGEPEAPLLMLEKLHASKKHSLVWLPGGQKLGTLAFNRSKVETKKSCLCIYDANATPLGEVLRAASPRMPQGILNYAIHDTDGSRIATLDNVPHRVGSWRGSYRLSIDSPLPEPLHTMLLAAALAGAYMRL